MRDTTRLLLTLLQVFLRTLEYYSVRDHSLSHFRIANISKGILFLTTNRVGKIDKAFKSRIHLSLLYPRLDLDSTMTIWENNLIAVEKDRNQGLAIKCNKEEILRFAKKHFKELDSTESKGRKKQLRVWNGRYVYFEDYRT